MAILDPLDEIASIVAAAIAVITLLASRKQDPQPEKRRFRHWWTPLRLRIAAGICTVLCLALVLPPLIGGFRHEPGDLRPGTEVPQKYRKVITETAHACTRPAVTPALVAAMLHAESGFDARKKSDATNEYGIAMWTPTVFASYAPPSADLFDPQDAIAAMGPLLCELALTVGLLPGDPQLLIAAGYRVGGRNVRAANGIPAGQAVYVEKVRKKIIEYGY